MNALALIWVVISTFGVLVSIHSLADINRDRAALGSRDGAARLLIAPRLRREIIRPFSLVLFLVVGILAVVPGTSDVERIGVYICLYGGTTGLIVNSLLEQVDRSTIRRFFP
mgnify:CR=1 FL=1